MKDIKMEEALAPQLQPQPQILEAGDTIADENLLHAFEQQNERLKQTLQEEFNKHLPLDTNTAPSSSEEATQGSNLWGLFQLRSPPAQHSLDQHDINTILAKNNELQQQIATLEGTKDSLWSEYCSLKDQYDSTLSELAEEKVKIAELESKTQTLRAMLIPANETQLSDGEVIGRFTSLHSQILKLVKTTWRRDVLKPGVRLTDEQAKLLGPYIDGKVDVKYLDNRLRRVIFIYVKTRILNARTYALGEGLTRWDEQLGDFEDLMWKKLPKDHHGSIIDWRIATMNATTGLRQGKYRRARIVQRSLWQFFQMFETRTDKSATEGARLLEKICNDAADLNLMMRNAKDEYLIAALPHIVGQPISEHEDVVEEEASQPARSQHPETVAYLITGALMKRPYGNLEDIKVLEKAQAVVYR
ncbi:hypothetical protein N0V93_008462 [Gnomoniopsis smithogilvyi]|uniref:Uncharacterized protein n=1 Tax=Gnomoniopsis smithogilvyi TaxID=1191159 RepID=A0A9W9CUW6_9PEZI|nr:hypothetical protein N0V93_008462 [Gnomoniopsis smithogilvyi]